MSYVRHYNPTFNNHFNSNTYNLNNHNQSS